jgi:hypothetical protein
MNKKQADKEFVVIATNNVVDVWAAQTTLVVITKQTNRTKEKDTHQKWSNF